MILALSVGMLILCSCGKGNPVGVRFSGDTDTEQDTTISPVAATMPSSCFVLPVPWLPQIPPGDWSNTKNCGQAVAVMLGGYFNHGTLAAWVITEENKWLAAHFNDNRYLSPNGWYTGQDNAAPLRELLWNFHALAAPYYQGSTAADVVWEGARGKPVIVGVKTNMGTTIGVSHWMLFVGWDGKYMYFADPGHSYRSNYGGSYFRYTVTQFEASWATQGKVYLPVTRR